MHASSNEGWTALLTLDETVAKQGLVEVTDTTRTLVRQIALSLRARPEEIDIAFSADEKLFEFIRALAARIRGGSLRLSTAYSALRRGLDSQLVDDAIIAFADIAEDETEIDFYREIAASELRALHGSR